MGAVLVTGATGFLGGALMDAFAADGSDAIGLGRNPAQIGRMTARGHRMIAHDLTDATQRLHPGAVDSIVHCAGLSSPFGPAAAFDAANVGGTRNIIALGRALGVRRLVHISTPSVTFRFADQLGVTETSALPPPVNQYARTKRLAENLVRDAPDLDPIILRPRGIYGAGDTALLPRLLRVARRGPLPLLRGGVAEIDLTHVNDVVAAVRAALAVRSQTDPVFHISGGQVLPLRQIAEMAAAKAGVDLRWRRMPLRPLLALAGVAETAALLWPGQPEPPVTRYGLGLFAYRQSLDLTKARRDLGWRPQIPFEQGLNMAFDI